jgi:uncharacterized protein (DUF1919 family)
MTFFHFRAKQEAKERTAERKQLQEEEERYIKFPTKQTINI